MTIVDIHTHAFPDAIAERAMRHLSDAAQVPAYLDGTVSALIGSMDGAGIDRSVVASIATKPSQFESILNWSRAIASDRIIPFPSIHPGDPEWSDRIDDVADQGFAGIKLHPYYQGFNVDDEGLLPFYAKLQTRGLVVLMHAGFDMAYDRTRCAEPARIARVNAQFPELKLVAAHLGAWEDWDEVRRHLIGRRIYLDTSYSLPFMSKDAARELIMAHPADYVLFGSDSPWEDQNAALQQLSALDLPEECLGAILGNNALRILGAS